MTLTFSVLCSYIKYGALLAIHSDKLMFVSILAFDLFGLLLFVGVAIDRLSCLLAPSLLNSLNKEQFFEWRIF